MTREQASTTKRADHMRMARLTVTLVAAYCLAATAFSAGQQTGVNSSDSALTELASQLHTHYGPVRFHREEDLEDRLIVRPTVGTIASGVPRVYLVEAEPFDISSGSVVARFGGRPPTMYVSVSRDGKSLYKLGGFDQAEQDFGRLVKDLPEQTIRAKTQAESRGRLCAEIVYELSSNWIVDGTSNVKLSAAQHFFDEGHSDGLELATKWWRKAKGDRGSLQVTTESASDGFLVNIPVIWAPVEGHSSLEVRLYRINVAADGSCQMNSSPTVILR